MKLTRRQEKFIQKMIELKREFACPIHYSILAKRLGVSPFTAYDMLCLLEEKGYVSSEYQLPADKSGPGRAERLFYLSDTAQVEHQQVVDQLSLEHLNKTADQADAPAKIRNSLTPFPELAEQMMDRSLPGEKGDMDYCVEVMTIAGLHLKDSPGKRALWLNLPKLLPGEFSQNMIESTQANLCLLGGFIYSLLVQYSETTPDWLEAMRTHLQRYTDMVMGLSDGDCLRLSEQLRGVFTSLNVAEAQ